MKKTNTWVILLLIMIGLTGMGVFLWWVYSQLLSAESKQRSISTAQASSSIEVDQKIEKIKDSVANINQQFRTYTNEYSMLINDFRTRIEDLEYVPILILSFANNRNIMEKGSTVNDITFNFSTNKVASAINIDNAIGSIAANETSLTKAVNINQNTTFILSVSDGKQSATKTTSLIFQNKVYWGVLDVNSLPNNETILALANSAFATTLNRSYSLNGQSKYPIYVYPVAFGQANYNVYGFGFNDFTRATISLTNASGYTENYYVDIFNNIQSGTTIPIIIS